MLSCLQVPADFYDHYYQYETEKEVSFHPVLLVFHLHQGYKELSAVFIFDGEDLLSDIFL
jgi:hypothetical protein